MKIKYTKTTRNIIAILILAAVVFIVIKTNLFGRKNKTPSADFTAPLGTEPKTTGGKFLPPSENVLGKGTKGRITGLVDTGCPYSVGATGDGVYYIQEFLRQFYSADITADGRFGPATQAALKSALGIDSVTCDIYNAAKNAFG